MSFEDLMEPDLRRVMGVYHIQRVIRLEVARTEKKGVDRHFSTNIYSRSSITDFERGRLKGAVAEMRNREQAGKLKVLRIEGLPPAVKKHLWFVGEPEYLERARNLVIDQIGPKLALLSDPTFMYESLIRGSGDPADWPAATQHFDGWWGLDTKETLTLPYEATGNSPWLVFRQKEDAKVWLRDLGFGA